MNNAELLEKMVETALLKAKKDTHRSAFPWPAVCGLMQMYLLEALNGRSIDAIKEDIESYNRED